MTSMTVGERMAKIETDVSYIKNQLIENKVSHDKMSAKFDKFIECADTKYASKARVAMIEKIVYGAVALILTSFLIVLINYAFIAN